MALAPCFASYSNHLRLPVFHLLLLVHSWLYYRSWCKWYSPDSPQDMLTMRRYFQDTYKHFRQMTILWQSALQLMIG